MIFAYSPDETDFSGRGNGPIFPTSAEIDGALNEMPTLSIEHPIDSAGAWKRIVPMGILRVPAMKVNMPEMYYIKYVADPENPSIFESQVFYSPGGQTLRDFIFRIKEVSYNGDSTINAECIAIPSELSDHFVASSKTGLVIDGNSVPEIIPMWVETVSLSYEKAGGFRSRICIEKEFSEKKLYVAQNYTSPDNFPDEEIDNMSCLQIFGQLIDDFRGEWYVNGTDIYAVEKMGVDRSNEITIEYGKNIISLDYAEDWSNVVNVLKIRGHNSDDNLVIEYESPLGVYPHRMEYYYDYEKAKVGSRGDDRKRITEEIAREMMKALAEKWFEKDEIDRPDVSIKINMLDYAKTEGYEHLAALKRMYLGDIVRAKSAMHGFDVKLRMTEYTYDAIKGEYTSITLGKTRTNLYETISRK